MRFVLLGITIVFLLGVTALTGSDVAHNGVTPLDVIALLIVGLFGVAIVGALISRPPDDDPTHH